MAHEALFDNWPRLTNWLDEDEQGRRLRAHLAPAALDWDQGGRPEADLYRGVRLDAAVGWAGEHPHGSHPGRAGLPRRLGVPGRAGAAGRAGTRGAGGAGQAQAADAADRRRRRRRRRGRRHRRGGGTAEPGGPASAHGHRAGPVGDRPAARRGGPDQPAAGPLPAARRVAPSRSTTTSTPAATCSPPYSAARRRRACGTATASPSTSWRCPITTRPWSPQATSGISSGTSPASRTAAATKLFLNAFTPLLAARPGTDEIAIANLTGTNDITYPMQLWDPRQQRQIGQDITRLDRAGKFARVVSRRPLVGRRAAARRRPRVGRRASQPTAAAHRTSSPGRYRGQSRLSCGVSRRRVRRRRQFRDHRAVRRRRGPVAGLGQPVRTFSVGSPGERRLSRLRPEREPCSPSATCDRHGHAVLARRRTPAADPDRTLRGRRRNHLLPDGRLIASLGDDNAVNVTDLVTNRLLGRLTGTRVR